MNIANGLGIPLTPLDAAQVITQRRMRRADVGEVNGKLFFETAGVGLDAELFGAARHAERGSWRRALRRVWRWLTHGTHRVGYDDERRRACVMRVVREQPDYAWRLPLLPDSSMGSTASDVRSSREWDALALIRSASSLSWGSRLPQAPVALQGRR